MKEIMQKFASYVSEKPPVYTSASETIAAITENINVESDIVAYVNENRTNINPPEEIQYVPYNSEAPAPPVRRDGGGGTGQKGGTIGKYKGAGDVDILSSKVWRDEINM